ncbi:MAG: FHA domain-containing protein [Akkermansia sp.]
MMFKTFIISSIILFSSVFIECGQASPSSEENRADSSLKSIPYVWDQKNTNLDSGVTFFYDKACNKLNIINLSLCDNSPIMGVEVKTGSNLKEVLSHDGWKENEQPLVAWHFFIDVSGGKPRDAAIQAELKTALEIIQSLPQKDQIYCRALGADIEDWGSATDETQKRFLIKDLDQKLKAKKYISQEGFGQSSLIYTGLSRIIHSLNVNTQSQYSVIVLLSDGNDETAVGERFQSKSKLISEAKGKHIPIHTLAFSKNSKDREHFPMLANMAIDTGGKYFASSLNTFQFEKGIDVAKELISSSVFHSGSLSLSLSQKIQDIQVKLFGKNGKTGILYIPQSMIVSLVPPVPSPVIKEDSKQSSSIGDVALISILKQINELDEDIRQLKQKETAKSEKDKTDIPSLVKEIEGHLDSTLKELNALMRKDQNQFNKMLTKLQIKEDVSDAWRHWLLCLKKLSTRKGNSPITKEEFLSILGRTTPLSASPIDKPSAWASISSPWILAGGGIFILIIIVIVFRKRGNSSCLPVAPEIPEIPEIYPMPANDCAPSPANNGTLSHLSIGAQGDNSGGVRPLLCELENIKDGFSWRIHQPTVTLGRLSSNDIRSDKPSVSSSHCVLKQERDGSWSLTDLGSANGIYFNKGLHRNIFLSDGDVFELGDVALRFRLCHITNN